MAQLESSAFMVGLICLVISTATAIWASFSKPKSASAGYFKGAGLPQAIHLITLMAGLMAITASLIVRAVIPDTALFPACMNSLWLLPGAF